SAGYFLAEGKVGHCSVDINYSKKTFYVPLKIRLRIKNCFPSLPHGCRAACFLVCNTVSTLFLDHSSIIGYKPLAVPYGQERHLWFEKGRWFVEAKEHK
ncbi:MAG: hypothetical protein SOX38_08050, partial [Candidatus Limiplasma sp.]|nr:hypothetical protein [Candidatus Limiplasma sp.]